MCNVPEFAPATPRPRWTYLFAILPLAAAALAAAELAVATPVLKAVAEGGIGLAVFGAMAWWVRANAAALDQLERCACASEKTQIRVVRPGRPSRHDVAEPIPVEVGDSQASMDEVWNRRFSGAAPVPSHRRRTGATLEG